MRQKFLLIKLAVKLATMFFKEFYRVSKEEIDNPNLFPQGNFKNCTERSRCIIAVVVNKIINYYATTIAQHREDEHGENHSDEKEELSTKLTTSEYESATTRGFWLR